MNRLLPLLMNAGVVTDVREYDQCEIQVTGLSGGDSLTFSRSLDGVIFVNWPAYDSAGTAYTTVSVNTIYGLDGGCFIRFTKAGVASNPTVIMRATN